VRPSVFARRDERGSILILSTVGVIVALISAALAVDLGRLAQNKRFNQKVADMAALDASRDLTTACARAKLSVQRNGFDPAGLDCIDPAYNPTKDVVIGRLVNGTFTMDPAGEMVKVRVASPFKAAFPFVSGPEAVSVKAVSGVRADAGFSIGSSLGRLDGSVQSPVLNRTLETLLGGSAGSLSLDAVGYNGLSNASVTLGDIRNELGFASVDELLTTDVKVKDLIDAMATILGGDTVLAARLNDISSVTSNSQTVKLGDIIQVDQGVGDKAAAGKVNVLQMIIASAEVANKANFAAGCVNIPNALSNSLVGTTKNKIGTDLCLKVTEPPKIYVGPVGGSRSTSQVEITFKPSIDVQLLGLPLGLGNLLKVVGQLPVTVTSAGATGTLSAVTCSGPTRGITVTVDTEAVKTTANGNVDIRLATDATNSGPLIAAGFNVSGTVTGPNQGATPLTFIHPGEFTPSANSKTTPGSPMALNMTSTNSGTINLTVPSVLPLVPDLSVSIQANVLAQAVLTAVNPVTLANNVLSQLQNLLASEEYAALGMRVGIADVAALAEFFNATACGNPALIG
jgi:uncharacterized membrane protein